jgi:hypothetical protein
MGARDLILVRLGVPDIFDGQLLPAKRFQRSVLQILAHLLDVILILLAEKPISNQVHPHPLGMGQPAQGTPEYDAVKPREGSLNLRLKLGDKLFHGVSSRYKVIWTSTNVPLRERHFSVCGLPLCGAGNFARSRLFRRLFPSRTCPPISWTLLQWRGEDGYRTMDIFAGSGLTKMHKNAQRGGDWFSQHLENAGRGREFRGSIHAQNCTKRPQHPTAGDASRTKPPP